MYLVLKNRPYKEKVDLQVEGAIFDEKGNLLPNIFNTGDSLAGNSFTIKMFEEYSKLGKLRDKLWVKVNFASNLFVVSPKVVSLFSSLKLKNLELLDLTISGKGIEISDYKLVNFLGKVDCVDDENSEMGYYTDTNPTYIYSIEWFSIHENKIPSELSIFLIDRTDNLVIIVKEDLIMAIQKEELVGFEFVKPEDFAIV